ncbi:MAG: hypothetical protein VYE22_41745 [Myxococcota bacterium]|nr:hypothetical protein [Myxococcota bacterium]
MRLDEIMELSADGTSRGDFAGWDPVTRCVITYRLTGTWGTPSDDSIEVEWTSIRGAVGGCLDETLDAPDADLTAEEGAYWDAGSAASGRLCLPGRGGAPPRTPGPPARVPLSRR